MYGSVSTARVRSFPSGHGFPDALADVAGVTSGLVFFVCWLLSFNPSLRTCIEF